MTNSRTRPRAGALAGVLGRRHPILDGAIEVEGAHDAVVIRRDEFGIPHIRAASTHDAWYGLGFCQGQDRAFQIEMRVRLGRGRLAEILGTDGVGVDALARRIGFHRVAAQQIEVQDDDVRGQIDAFVAGLNEGVRRGLPKRPHEFALLRSDPLEVTPADVLATLALISFLLASNWDSELVRLQILRHDGVEALRDLDPTYPEDLVVTDQADARLAPVDALTESLDALLEMGGAGAGSNNWAVSGERTASGNPLVANDPHLSPALPAHWYLSHLRTPEWEVAGASLVGTPGFSLGHNGRVAWGVTAGQTDNTDLFIEELRNGDSECRGPAGWEPTERWTETIKVARAEDVDVELVRTPRGVIVSDTLDGDHGALALKATWHRLVPSRGVLTCHEARSAEELGQHFDPWPALPINLVSGDVDGHIAWQLVGDVPRRRKGHGVIPLPGWDPEVGWEDEPEPFDRLPSALDPESGWLATANNKATHEPDPWITHDWLDGYRVSRIGEMLAAKDDWTPDDFGELLLDRHSLVWRELAPLVHDAVAVDSRAELALRLLADFDGNCDTDSVAASVFELWVASMCRRVTISRAPNAGEWAAGRSPLHLSGPGSVASRRIQHLAGLMADRPDGWFDHGWESEAGRALSEVVGELIDHAGEDQSEWAWGRLRPLTLEHPLGALGPFGHVFNIGPIPWGGSAHTINNGGVNLLEPFSNPVGIASCRFVAPVGDWDEVRISLPGGQSGNPTSPHYADQVNPWLSAEGVPLPWSEGAVAASTKHLLTLVPGLS